MKLFEIQDSRQSVIADLKQEVIRAAGRDSRFLTFEIFQSREGSPELAVRDFGHWEVPDDEEDDGDYDWKVPSRQTIAALDQITKAVSAKHPQMIISSHTGEKNWIYWTVRERT